MIGSAASILLAIVVPQVAEVQLLDCAAKSFELAALEEAIRVEPTTAGTRLRISLPNCDVGDPVRLELLGPDGVTRTATVSLRDVMPRFRYRTLAYVASDLATQPGTSVATNATPERRSAPRQGPLVARDAARDDSLAAETQPGGAPTSNTVAALVGVVVRPDVTPNSTGVSLFPFAQVHFDLEMTRRWRLRMTTSHEFSTTDSYWYYGGRVAAGPNFRIFDDGSMFIDTAVQYYGGVVAMQGRGNGAIQQVAVSPAHGPRMDVSLGFVVSDEVSIEVMAGGGFEWGAEGQRVRQPLISTHGFFARSGVTFAFRP